MTAIATETKLAIGPDSAGMLLTPEEFDATTDYDDFESRLLPGFRVPVAMILASADMFAERL